MEVAARAADRGTAVSIAVVVSSVVALAAAVVASGPLKLVAPVLLLAVVLALAWRAITPWPRLLSLMLLVILFVPIRRYELPFRVGIQMEPYRLLVALIVVGWLTSLLIDPRVRARRTGFEGPILLLFLNAIASEAANHARFASVQAIAIKQLSFLFSFMLVLYVMVSVIRRADDVDRLVRVLVAGGAFVGASTLFEARTQFNLFDHLSQVIPFLRIGDLPYVGNDGRGYRAYASAQHPISLGAALVILVPLGVYLIHSTRQKRWWIATALLLFGALVTRSRTGVLMLVAIAVAYAILRPREMKRLWPALLPLVLALHFAAPGTVGTIKQSFFPKGGLAELKEQQNFGNGRGRIASLGPGLKEWRQHPIVGEGFGTRVVDGLQANAPILDDQWLTTLLDSGIVGVFAWGWLFTRAIRRFGGAGRRDRSDTGWLYCGVAAAVAGFAVSMATYDAFAFIQVTFLLFILVGLGQAFLDVAGETAPAGLRPRGPW